MSSLFQELRFAVRTLAKSPRFALLAVATLALSIGSTSALFSVVNAVLLKPLPYRDPDNLFQFSGAGLQRGRDRLSPGDYLDIKRRAQSFAPLAGYRSLSCELSGNGEPQRLHAADVTADFFEVFGIGARLGRLFDARQDRPGSGRRAVLSHGLWTRRFGSDSSVLGKTIRVDGESVAVVGIAPASFDWPAGTEIWTVSAGPVPAPPMQVPEDPLQNRDLQYIEAIARLAPGVDRRAAQAETAVIAADLERRFVQSNRGRTWRLVVLQEQLVGGIRQALAVLLGAVAFVWLVSCANIATLMLARAAGRQREMSIRSALGASRARLVRQLVTEGLVLSLAGGAAGLAAASSGTDLLRRLAPAELPRISEVSLDGRAALVAMVLSLAAGLLFGLAPALSASRLALAGSLREGSRPTGGARRKSLQSALVVAELALALTLLSGAGLLANSFFRLQRVDPGFLPEGLQSVWLPLPQTRYPDAQRQAAFYTELVRRLRAAPELSGAAAIYPLPLRGDGASAPARPAEQGPEKGGPIVEIISASPGYFRFLQTSLRAGRDFDDRDSAEGPPTAIVSAALARQFWPAADPLGRSVRIGAGADAPTVTVIGVAPDIRLRRLADSPSLAIYLPMQQFVLPVLSVAVRGRFGSEPAAAALRREVRALDPELPFPEVLPVTRVVDDSIAQPRFRTLLLGAFAAAALALATLGVYGIVSGNVAARTREFGVRMAIGASPGQVLRMVLHEGLWLALVGLGFGLAGAVALTRVLKSLLYGVGATDLPTLAAVSALLSGAALIASLVPARRATRVDPSRALQAE